MPRDRADDIRPDLCLVCKAFDYIVCDIPLPEQAIRITHCGAPQDEVPTFAWNLTHTERGCRLLRRYVTYKYSDGHHSSQSATPSCTFPDIATARVLARLPPLEQGILRLTRCAALAQDCWVRSLLLDCVRLRRLEICPSRCDPCGIDPAQGLSFATHLLRPLVASSQSLTHLTWCDYRLQTPSSPWTISQLPNLVYFSLLTDTEGDPLPCTSKIMQMAVALLSAAKNLRHFYTNANMDYAAVMLISDCMASAKLRSLGLSGYFDNSHNLTVPLLLAGISNLEKLYVYHMPHSALSHLPLNLRHLVFLARSDAFTLELAEKLATKAYLPHLEKVTVTHENGRRKDDVEATESLRRACNTRGIAFDDVFYLDMAGFKCVHLTVSHAVHVQSDRCNSFEGL